jgi:hypothetical protein
MEVSLKLELPPLNKQRKTKGALEVIGDGLLFIILLEKDGYQIGMSILVTRLWIICNCDFLKIM